MALTKDSVISTGPTTGITLETYEGKCYLKSTRSYKSKDGNEVLTYDWIYPEVYDQAQKKRVVADKPRPMSIPLGTQEQAISALHSILLNLGWNPPHITEAETPF
jgi:hypothetical protein